MNARSSPCSRSRWSYHGSSSSVMKSSILPARSIDAEQLLHLLRLLLLLLLLHRVCGLLIHGQLLPEVTTNESCTASRCNPLRRMSYTVENAPAFISPPFSAAASRSICRRKRGKDESKTKRSVLQLRNQLWSSSNSTGCDKRPGCSSVSRAIIISNTAAAAAAFKCSREIHVAPCLSRFVR